MPIKGGITNYVFNLVNTLNLFNLNTIVITRYGSIDKNIYVINKKIHLVIKSYLILSRNKPDIIHAHSNWYTLAAGLVYKKTRPRTKIVFTFHTQPTEKIGVIKKIIFQSLLSRCDVITFVSKKLKEEIEENYKITADTKIIYAGVAAKKVDGNEIKEFTNNYSLDNNNPIVTFIGPLILRQKIEGVKILIKSFKIIKNKYPNSKLLIIGDGPYKKKLQLLAQKLSIDDAVLFTGYLDNVFIPLAVTDIYAHISLQEGFPISLLEAMSVGKPVIASRTGGIPEVIKNNENGILVEADPTKIGKTIIELYEDKEKMHEMGKNAKETVEENYNWEKIGKEYLHVYLEGLR